MPASTPFQRDGLPFRALSVIPRRSALAGLSLAPLLLAAPTLARAAPAEDLLHLDSYRGKVVYIDFWASWCGPCKLSFPFMQRMLSAFHRDDFVILTVNMDHNRQRADAFLSDQNQDGLPVIYDPSGQIAKRFGVKAMPTSLVVDKSGVVRFTNEGFFTDRVSAYEAHIWELLSEKH